MSEFKREERYVVVKLKDLTSWQKEQLKDTIIGEDIPTKECVVVEPDWPNYEQTWRDIEAVTKGGFQDRQALIQKIDKLERKLANRCAVALMYRSDKGGTATFTTEAVMVERHEGDSPGDIRDEARAYVKWRGLENAQGEKLSDLELVGWRVASPA